jgi:signal transduction histidine kinase
VSTTGPFERRALQRRLLLSYVGAFAVVIFVFAGAVRVLFATLLHSETSARLNTLARAGTAAVLFTPTSFRVDAESFGGFSVREDSEGLEWFDAGGKLISRRGETPRPPSPPVEGTLRVASDRGVLDTYTLKMHDPQGVNRGYVRASEVYNPAADPERVLERGLIAGAALALIVGALGGTLLARAAVTRAEVTYDRLRQFTADASHELRGPLAALASTASVAVREAPELSELTRGRLEVISSLSGHMRRLVDDLLILARADRSMQYELFAVDLDQVFGNVRARYGHEAEQRAVSLTFSLPANLEIYGNPDQIERIVANLVENAVRHSAPGANVGVSCGADQSRAFVRVADTGRGIAPQNLERIFDRFWRGDSARAPERGTGLGLAIARALARRHGGDVLVESEIGRGSTFTLELPLRPPSLD